MKKNRPIQILFLLVVLLLVGLPPVLAQASPRVQITAVDASEFPLVRLTLIATNEDSSRISDISGLSLTENGAAVETYEEGETPVGTEIIFVIDANSTIDTRDEAGGLTRREKVRDSIIRYATEFMDDAQLDRVSILVPAEDGTPSILLDRAMFPNAVLNEINFYETPGADPSPVNELLALALEHAAAEQGRFQAIVLFSDSADLGDQLDYPALIEQAQAINIPIFGAILGARADENEINNVMQLAGPTRGSYVHMPEVEAIDPLYTLFQTHKPQYELSYQSAIKESGIHQISADLGGTSANSEFEVVVEPPLPEIVVDNSRPIRRVVPQPDAPLTDAEPAVQPVVVQITWPDGHPRPITEATLLVNGNPQPPVESPEMSADGLITLDWDISPLDEGSYQLSVTVADDLGLTGDSGGFPMVIEVDGRAPVEQPGTGPGEEVEAPEEVPEESSDGLGGIGTTEILLGLLVLVIAVGAVLIIIVFMRRSDKEGQVEESPPSPPQPAAAPDHEATQVIRPAFAAQGAAQAYLEPVENAPEHKGQIPVPSNNVTIGRDPNLAQIVFSDKSVSRLHARILEENGVFQLYDEGSASGTYINFEQVGLRPQALKDNDQIHIGRVHLVFHAQLQVQDADSTQVMPAPMRPSGQPPPAEQEDLSTQPYMPNQPPGGAPQPPPAGGQTPAGGDEDDISTQPYMPHSPKR